MARLVACAFDERHIVVVGAGGPRQDAHEVAVVAQVLKKAGHPPLGEDGEVGAGRGGVGGGRGEEEIKSDASGLPRNFSFLWPAKAYRLEC